MSVPRSPAANGTRGPMTCREDLILVQHAVRAIVAFCVLDAVDLVDLDLATSQVERAGVAVEADLSILPQLFVRARGSPTAKHGARGGAC